MASIVFFADDDEVTLRASFELANEHRGHKRRADLIAVPGRRLRQFSELRSASRGGSAILESSLTSWKLQCIDANPMLERTFHG